MHPAPACPKYWHAPCTGCPWQEAVPGPNTPAGQLPSGGARQRGEGVPGSQEVGWPLAHTSRFHPGGNRVTGRREADAASWCAGADAAGAGGSPTRRRLGVGPGQPSLCARSPQTRSPPGGCPGAGAQPRAPLACQDWLGPRIREEVRLLPPLPAPPPPPSSASTLTPSRRCGAGLGAAWLWAQDERLSPLLEMDSRYTSATDIGDLNHLSAAIPATRVEVSVSCR